MSDNDLRIQNFLDRLKKAPYDHQIVGVNALLQNPYFGLFDEMGAGKTKQVIDAAQILYEAGRIDTALVVAPSAVRSVWTDPELGELKKHLWDSNSSVVSEYHARTTRWAKKPVNLVEFRAVMMDKPLQWIVTNYDFIRQEERLKLFIQYANPRTLLILDESSAVKNHSAKQTNACYEVRLKCGRVWLLNGTPISNNPLDMYSQGNMMHPEILGAKTFFHFRARYAILGGWKNRQIVEWQNLEDLQARLKPYVIRRLKIDCLDLPPKLPSVSLTVPLSTDSWNLYRDMRDQLVVWLNSETASVASQAAVKAMRLSQITSGFLGGLEELKGLNEDEVMPDFIKKAEDDRPAYLNTPKPKTSLAKSTEIGREKLDLVLNWIGVQRDQDPKFKVLVWCRFVAELERFAVEIKHRFPDTHVGRIYGGQTREERDYALRLGDPRTSPDAPVVIVGTPASGSMGLNLTAICNVVRMSSDYSLKTRLQSDDRVHRPGQTRPVSYFDVIATGPSGQKTIDHGVAKALNDKNEIATWTTAAWVQILTGE